jgi:hypothetical protein
MFVRTWVYWQSGAAEIAETQEYLDAAYRAGAKDSPAAFSRPVEAKADEVAARAARIAEIDAEIQAIETEPEAAEATKQEQSSKRRGRPRK